MRHYLTRFGALTAAGVLLAALPMCAKDASPPSSSAGPSGNGDEESVRAALAGTPLGQVISRDPSGHARVILGGLAENRPALNVRADTAARVHLLRHAEPLGLNDAAVRGAVVASTHTIPGDSGGASIVQFEQRIDGMEVFQSRASVLLDGTKNLVQLSSNLHIAGTAEKSGKWDFSVPVEDAMANIYSAHFGVPLTSGAIRDTGPVNGGELRGLKVTTAKNAPRLFDATAKRVLFPEKFGLVPAYYMEFISRTPGSRDNETFGYVMSAKDGRVLFKSSLTQHEKFKYRVWAEAGPGNIPMDGPYKDYTPNPDGAPVKNKRPDFNLTPNLIEMDGFNAPKDPWLAATATATSGNNVHAYSDRTDTHAEDDAGNPTGEGDGFGPGDIEATVTAPLTFDRVYDTSRAPNITTDQIQAAVTQIFYTTNWMHDYWYDSGFDEKSGVAQVNNFGRGGAQGDPLLAEAQDGADHGAGNNANMSTPADGKSPTMQMFVWTGLANRKITTTPPLTFDDGYGVGPFGPATFDRTADAVLASDGVSAPGGGTPTDGCEAMTGLTGKIAVLDRGLCAFTDKVKNAQNAGAVGVIAINNQPGHSPVSPGGSDPTLTIPLLILSKEDGQKLKDQIGVGPVSAQVFRGEETLHDGTIDNTIVAHEWGHYLHHRLVKCGNQACGGMSEGWADFNALLMVVREGDNLENTAFPLSQYATASDNYSAYFGIRRAPYSTDFTKNPFTFKHMQGSAELPTTAPILAGGDMSEVHNVGEIWAETLFEGYVNLQKTPTGSFQDKKRRMANYIVAGMKAAPTQPSFTEQRDAILAAVWASGQKDDFTALAKGFAKRGMGVGAVSPIPPADPNEDTLEGIVESFEVDKGDVTLLDAKVAEGTSCDNDGVLDAGESGTLTLQIRNGGWAALKDTQVKVTVDNASVTLGNGSGGTVASLDPYASASVVIPISIAKGATVRGAIPLQITLTNASAVKASVAKTFTTTYNFDEAPKTSATDDAESAATPSPWTMGHAETALDAWSRRPGDGTNHVWHGDDVGSSGDETLVSPELVVGTDNFTISFKQRYVFEYTPPVESPTAPKPAKYWDTGVLELTEDGGTTWKDISTYVDPKYTATTLKSNSNVLTERPAWGGVSPGYPAFEPVSLNLEKKLSGKTVKIRFRIGTDAGAGAGGWDLDDIAFAGITNKPFGTQVANVGVCVTPPTPDAGPQGVPLRFTNDDSMCAVSAVGSNSSRGLTGLGIFAGLMMLLRRRRRTH